jgi:hypothetical protein
VYISLPIGSGTSVYKVYRTNLAERRLFHKGSEQLRKLSIQIRLTAGTSLNLSWSFVSIANAEFIALLPISIVSGMPLEMLLASVRKKIRERGK